MQKPTNFNEYVYQQLEQLMGDCMPELVARYESMMRTHLKQIVLAMAREDMTLLAQQAHSLKAPNFQIGAERVGELAAQLEQLAKQQELAAIKHNEVIETLHTEAHAALQHILSKQA